MHTLTVCITSFKRPEFLKRALKSCIDAGIQMISIFSMDPDKHVFEVVKQFKIKPSVNISFNHLPVDLGCQETWLQSAYRATTKWVLVLHDDDMLSPDFGDEYINTIKPVLESGRAGFASWRGHLISERLKVSPVEYYKGETGIYPSSHVQEVVMTKSRLSLSPIISVFNREVLIESLKECCEVLLGEHSHLHPGMTLGTEILAYLRQCFHSKNWLYVNKVLSFYGHHPGSGTVAAQNTGDLSHITVGYDYARDYFLQVNEYKQSPRILLVYNDYKKNTFDEQRRCDNADFTWKFHINQGTILPFQISNFELPRTSEDIGDSRHVPYVHDLIDYGMQFATDSDIVAIINRDICLTTMAPDRIISGVSRGNGFGVAIMRSWKNNPSHRLHRTVRNCKQDGGHDLFAMTKSWWNKHKTLMPDMLFGREAWDNVMRLLAEETSGKEIYMDDVIYHEPHQSFWMKERTTNPGQLHNRRLAVDFFIKHPNPEMLKWLK